MSVNRAFAILGGALLLATASEARQATGGLQDVAVIQDGHGAARILFRLSNQVRTLSQIRVWKATLRVPLAGLPAGRELRLRAYPVTAAWNPSTVSWTGWRRPGGDFDDEVFAERTVDLRTGPTEVVLDVTGLVKEVVERRMPGDGFILSVDPRSGVGLPVADLPRFVGLGAATLQVTYRKSLQADS
ncbi:MAG: hypothetical protein U0167_09395 [bacterium]